MPEYRVCVVNKNGDIKETSHSINLLQKEADDPIRNRSSIVGQLFKLYGFNTYMEYYQVVRKNNNKDIAITYNYSEGCKDTWLLKPIE